MTTAPFTAAIKYAFTCSTQAPKVVGAVALFVIAAAEAVDRDDVPLQAEAEDTAENSEQSEGGSADAIVVEGDLTLRIAQIQNLEQPPDIGLENRCRAIACAIR